jgi:hypothetical protein
MNGNNEITTDLTDSEKLDLIIRKVAALEAAEAERKKETKPRLDTLIAEVAALRVDVSDLKLAIDRIFDNFGMITLDVVDLRAAQSRLSMRVSVIERGK